MDANSRLIIVLLSLLLCAAGTAKPATYLDCLIDFERHAESIWHDATYSNSPPGSGYFGDGKSDGNGGIRGSCGVALAYAVLAHALPTDPKRPMRLARVQEAINYAANTHLSATNVCVDGLRWGRGWQTSLWAGSMGFACLLVQSNLPASAVQACQRAIADEATYRSGIPPVSGFAGDTKAEENAWNANVVALAAAWLYTHTNSGLWLEAAKKYLVNTYSVPDSSGDPLAAWITTTNLYPSYALENHGFYHPLYQMVSGMSLGDSLLMARVANTNVATQLQPFAEHNVLNVWKHLSRVVLDSGEFAFPSGLDWAMHTFQQNSYYAWLAAGFNDPLARWAGTRLVELLRHRQQVNGDGTFLDGTEPNVFYMEAVIARRTAIAWLQHEYAVFSNGPAAPPANSVEHSADIKLITQNSPWGFVSLSYGPKIMGLVEPAAASIPTNAILTTPRMPGIIGLGALGSPTSAQLITLATNVGGFEAQLTLQHGNQGTTEVYVESTGEAVAIVEVPHPSVSSLAAAGSFTVGIENDPLTGGSRLLEWTGGSTTVTNRTGVARGITNKWVCVAGRYGLAAGPAGYFKYQAASSYNRLGGAEDTLQFMPSNSLGARYAVWFPGKNAAQTMAGAGAIFWSVSASNATLTFPGLGGAPRTIVASLPPPQLHPAYVVAPVAITASSSSAGYPPTNALDGNQDTFWVSSGSKAGQGPTTSHPEWLRVSFPRLVAISGFEVSPRTYNGGYGPKAVEMLFDDIPVYQGTMAATATLAVRLPQPVHATNAQLLITSSYDPSYPTNSRNVQVVELAFFERAWPDTFADWSLRHFTDGQLADPDLGGSAGDFDKDGLSNLLEFTTGGNPLSADSSPAELLLVAAPPASFAFRFRERVDLGDVQRRFENSANLVDWTELTPSQLTTVTNLGDADLREAVFPSLDGSCFFRLKFFLQSIL